MLGIGMIVLFRFLVVTGEKSGAFAEDSLFSNSHWTPGAIGLSMLSVTYAFDGWCVTIINITCLFALAIEMTLQILTCDFV